MLFEVFFRIVIVTELIAAGIIIHGFTLDYFPLLLFAFLMGIIFLANWVVRTGSPSTLYRLLVGGLLGLLAAWIGIVLLNIVRVPAVAAAVTPQTTVAYATIGGIFFLVCVSVSIDRGFRQVLAKTIFRYTAYDPDSVVHTLALILIIVMLQIAYGNFILDGGLQGIATDVAAERQVVEATGTPDYAGFLENLGYYILLSCLGVGLFVRRGIRATLQRLGVRFPGIGEWAAGIGFGLAMYTYLTIFSVVLYTLLPQPTYQSLWGVSIMTDDTLLYGFLMAFSAGVGEELIFRGALQPIFGVWLTSIVFVIIHTNYTFTLSWVIIGVHALIFAWLRQRANTTTAMMAHFTYNFMPYLLMAWLA